MAEWIQAVPVVLLGVGLVLGVVDLVWWAVLAGRRHVEWEATVRARSQAVAAAREEGAMAPYAAMFEGLDQGVGAVQAAVGTVAAGGAVAAGPA